MENEAFAEYRDQATEIFVTYGVDVLGGILILIIGWWFASWAARAAGRTFSRFDKIDETLSGFFASAIKYIILIFVVLAVLDQFGVQTTSLIAIFGAAGLAVGLALQGTLSNVASGVMLLFFRPFKVGQFVDAGGTAGTVKSINLFTTELATPDNVQIIVPNSAIWGSNITNYNGYAQRRVDFLLGIGYDDDIDKAVETILAVVGEEDRVKHDPAPFVGVGELADSSVNMVVRVWVEGPDYWGVKFDLMKAFKQRFDSVGLSIPYPQHDIHLIPGQE